MNFKKIGIIIRREYLNRVKKKSFLIITFLAPILFAALILLPSLIMTFSKEDAKTVGVVDESGIVLPALESNESLTFTEIGDKTYAEAKEQMESLGVDIVLHIGQLDTVARTVLAECVSRDPVGMDSQSYIESRINDAVEKYRIDSYNIENLQDIMEEVKTDIHLQTWKMDEKGNESLSESGILMALSMILGIAIYMFIMMFCGMVMSSVIEEKSSRVVEVLISSVKSTELMFGKIIGVALVALTQFFLWIVLTLAIVLVASRFINVGDMLAAASGPEAAMVVDQVNIPGMDMDAVSLTEAADSTAVSTTPAPSAMEAIVSTVKHLELGKLLIAFFLYFIFGYLLYASLFAAIGSAVENEGDSQQLQIPITAPLFIGFFIAIYAFRAPGSGIVWWGSMIPFTSPIVMLARIPVDTVSWGEIGLSIGLLLLTFILCAWLSAKIYKIGVLMFGKKTTFKDLWKWLKQK